MIKIKNIIKEHKIIMTEAFKAGKLRVLANNWRGLDSDFWSYGAKLGIEWDQITDKEIETNTKPKKKGIEIAYVDKDVTVPGRGRETRYYTNSDFKIYKFTAVSVLKDGKPLWYTKGWKPLTNVMTATGKKTKDSFSGRRSTIPDVKAGSRSYSKNKQFGANIYGYQSLAAISKIPGIKFHHINLESDQPYMGAGVKRQMRQAAQFGASKFTTNDEFARINKTYFDDLMKKRLNDPKKLAAKLKTGVDRCKAIIDAAIGGKKATGPVKKIIDDFTSKMSNETSESKAYRLVAQVSRQLADLYGDYARYQEAIQKEKEDKVKYGTTDFARDDVESAAKEFQYEYNRIMKSDFRY